MAVPKIARAEIGDDSITISVIGDLRHAAVGGGLRKALTKHLRGTGDTATEGPAKGFVIGPEVTGERRG
ncbi:hypothetical protein [Kitasatospora sp. NPDC094016]|uniref:hypothetical protein n=1 Tax=Kitasatospora sp. NPDC094016 TaxID=3154986 RepID=UPI0033208D2A